MQYIEGGSLGKGEKGSRMGQRKQMSNVVEADVVSSFNLILQGNLEYEFHQRVPFEASGVDCGVSMPDSH